MAKAKVTLGGIVLAGNSSISWKLQTGVQPYTAIMSVPVNDWSDVQRKILKPVDLEIIDSQGTRTTIRDLFILHRVASDSPHRASFLVADRRWKWSRNLVVRDYNVLKKTGDRVAKGEIRPASKAVSVDQYDYRAYSLNNGNRWKAQDAVKDILKLIEAEDGATTVSTKKVQIESFPIPDSSEGGQFSLQNVYLRDAGDVALARLMSYIPGAEVYVDQDGFIRVFDASDLKAAEDYFKRIEPATWDGDKAEFIDRIKVRPSEVRVYYQREIELVLEFEDDITGGTRAQLNGAAPYIENVIKTVDPQTTVTEFDPETRSFVQKVVPPGTWVTAEQFLAAMDKVKPAGSKPWTGEMLRRAWIHPGLDGVLVGEGLRGVDQVETGSVTAAIGTLKEHFRQTFRINRSYVERMRDIQAVRVAVLDPVTGTRAPAAVWGKACVIPSTKGSFMVQRKNAEAQGRFRNLNSLPAAGEQLADKAPGPASVSILDRDLGIFKVVWHTSPYGTDTSIIPSNLVDTDNRSTVPTRDLALQASKNMHPGLRVESGTEGSLLDKSAELKVMVTIVTSAPNNKKQFH
jgi:hypothetical protein